MANIREKGQELYNFLHSFVESAGQELSEAFTSASSSTNTAGNITHSAGGKSGGGGVGKASETSEEADLQATIDFMFTPHAATYHHVLQPFYALMIRFFRDPDEKYRNFCMQCVPAIIWHYVEVSSYSQKQLENVDVPESLRNKLYGIAELPGIDRATSMASDLRGAKASLEALILEIYNYNVCDADGNPVRVNLTIPSLAIPSVYHDSSSFTSLALLGGSKMESEMQTVSRDFGVGPQDHIHLGNRWRILKTILHVFNVDMANNSKHAVEAFLKLVANVTTSGFPPGTFALTSSVPKVVNDESQTNLVTVGNNIADRSSAADAARPVDAATANTSQVPFSTTPVTKNNPIIDSPLSEEPPTTSSDQQQQQQQTPIHQTPSGTHSALYVRSQTTTLPSSRDPAAAVRASQQSITAGIGGNNTRVRQQRNNSIRVLKEKLQRSSSNRPNNNNNVSIATSAVAGQARRGSTMLTKTAGNDGAVPASNSIVAGPSLHGVGRNRVRIHAPSDFYTELLYGLYCVGVNYLFNAASKHRKANVREHDKIISITSAELIQAVRIRTTLEMMPTAQMTASSVYRLWAWQYAKLVRQSPEIRFSVGTSRDTPLLNSMPAFGGQQQEPVGGAGALDVRASSKNEDREAKRASKADRHHQRDTSPFSHTRSQMKNAAKELFSLKPNKGKEKRNKNSKDGSRSESLVLNATKSHLSSASGAATAAAVPEYIPLVPLETKHSGPAVMQSMTAGTEQSLAANAAAPQPTVKLVSFASSAESAAAGNPAIVNITKNAEPRSGTSSAGEDAEDLVVSETPLLNNNTSAGRLQTPHLRVIPEQQPANERTHSDAVTTSESSAADEDNTRNHNGPEEEDEDAVFDDAVTGKLHYGEKAIMGVDSKPRTSTKGTTDTSEPETPPGNNANNDAGAYHALATTDEEDDNNEFSSKSPVDAGAKVAQRRPSLANRAKDDRSADDDSAAGVQLLQNDERHQRDQNGCLAGNRPNPASTDSSV